MRIVIWALWLVVFVLFFGFALNNTAPTALHFFSGWIWQAPLIGMLLAFFFGGVVCGFLAMLPTWVRLRLEIRQLKKRALIEKTLSPDTATMTAHQADVIQSVAQGARTTR